MKKFFKRLGWKASALLFANTIICVLIGTRVLRNLYFIAVYNGIILTYAYIVATRLPKVLRFSQDLGTLALRYGMRHIDEIMEDKSLDPFDWFIGKEPGFNRLLFSRKPLTLEAWFDEETIKKINS